MIKHLQNVREKTWLDWVNDILPTATQPTFTCWKLTIETLEQGVKYVEI